VTKMKKNNHKMLLMSLTLFPFLLSPAMSETLGQVVQETLSSNPQVLASENEKLAREQQLKQARGGYYPSIDITAGAGTEHSKNPATVSKYGDNDFHELTRSESAITLRQNLFSGFDTSSQVDQQQARVKAAEHMLASSRDEISLRTSQVYLDVIRKREILTLAKKNLSKHQVIFNKVQQRSKSGVGRSSDLDQARGRLSLARSNLAASKANLFASEANYMRVVGKAVPAQMQKPNAVDEALPSNIDIALTNARQTNPLIASASAEVTAATAIRDGSKSGYYPKLDLVLSSAWNENLDGIEAKDEEKYAMLQLRWNVFNGGSDSARNSEKAHLYGKAKNSRDDALRLVDQTVRLAWGQYVMRKSQVVDLNQHYKSSLKTRNSYDKQFRIGKRTLLDLLDTENEVFQSGRAYTNAQYDLIQSQHKVLESLGLLSQTLAK